MNKPSIIWLRGSHEHRNYYIKYGFMLLHQRGEITFLEMDRAKATSYVPKELTSMDDKALSLLIIQSAGGTKTIAIDGEDSLFQLSKAIEHVDLYCTSTYCESFYRNLPFDLTLPWQTESDIAYYRDKYNSLQETYSHLFYKVRKIGPLGPSMDGHSQHHFLKQKWLNARHKFHTSISEYCDWKPQFNDFQHRWRELLLLRTQISLYDIVLKDTVWGWPQNRIELHQQLSSLADRYAIHTELRPQLKDTSSTSDLQLFQTPLISGCGLPEPYESAISKSRLAVYATGFHWGGRTILTLAAFLGIPIFSDPFITQAPFPWSKWDIQFRKKTDWSEIESHLKRTHKADCHEQKKENQKRFDETYAPDLAANIVLQHALI